MPKNVFRACQQQEFVIGVSGDSILKTNSRCTVEGCFHEEESNTRILLTKGNIGEGMILDPTRLMGPGSAYVSSRILASELLTAENFNEVNFPNKVVLIQCLFSRLTLPAMRDDEYAKLLKVIRLRYTQSANLCLRCEGGQR